MKQAKLIKRGEQQERKNVQAQAAKEDRIAFVRNTLNVARTWVRDFQANDRQNARQQFAELFV